MGPSSQQSLTWYRPTQLAAHDRDEGRAFQFFTHMVGPILSGPTNAYFWTHLVMQFSHFEPSVRHAVLSISSLYEGFSQGSRISRQLRTSRFSIVHYNAAIARAKSSANEQVILLLCILFVCIEYLRGDIDAALRHCRSGIAILNSSVCTSWVRDDLLPIFRRMSSHPLFIGAGHLALPAANCLSGFATVMDAQVAMDDLAGRVMVCKDLGSSTDKQHLAVLLDEWRAQADDLEATIPPCATFDKFTLCGLRIKHKVATISVQTPSKPSELWFDQHLDEFNSIVNMAEIAYRLKTTIMHSATRVSFTFEMGFLALMFFVVIKCRCLRVRLEALTWMVQLSAAKEGPLDVGTLFRVGIRHIEIEHGVQLDDYSNRLDELDTTQRFPSLEHERVFAAPVNHELELYCEDNGVTQYRREVHFLMRGQDGHVIDNLEYITDMKPVQTSLQVPNMRSAF